MSSSFIGDASSPAAHARCSEAVAVLGGGVVGNGIAARVVGGNGIAARIVVGNGIAMRVVVGNGIVARVGLPEAGWSDDDDSASWWTQASLRASWWATAGGAGGSDDDDDVCGRCTGTVVLGMFQSALDGAGR